jgi:hypothetical protein
MDLNDYDISNPQDLQRFLMVAQAELLNCLHTIELDFSRITECYTTCDVSSGSADSLLKIDKVTYEYIMALIALHVYYQELLKIRDIETPTYWTNVINKS